MNIDAAWLMERQRVVLQQYCWTNTWQQSGMLLQNCCDHLPWHMAAPCCLPQRRRVI